MDCPRTGLTTTADQSNTRSSNEAADRPLQMAIVGAGLGGVILGIGLARRGVSVHIYEAARGFGEIGAGVTMGPNAVQALGLLSPELLQAFEMHMTSNASSGAAATFLTFRRGSATPLGSTVKDDTTANINNAEDDDDGDFLFHLSNTESAPGWTQAPVRMAVHRARFLDEIVKQLPRNSVSFNKTLIEVRETAGGQTVELLFADGTTASRDAVVGCDGIKSVTRRFVHGEEATPSWAGEYAYRALVPTDVFQEHLGLERAMNGQMYVGPGRYIITYPVEHGKFVNIVAVVRLPPDSVWAHDAWLVPCSHEEVSADFAGWDQRLLDLLTRYGAKDKWALFHYAHSRSYYRGRVCLLGDSAHAATPHLGAGAGQAIEDAYVLAGLLGEHRYGAPGGVYDIQGLFAAYDAVRRPRSQQLVRWSYLTGLTYMFQEGNPNESDMEGMKILLGERLRWLYSEDLVAHLDEAKGILAKRGGI